MRGEEMSLSAHQEVPELDWERVPLSPYNHAFRAPIIGGHVYVEFDLAHWVTWDRDHYRAWTDHAGHGSSLRFGGRPREAIIASLAFAVGGSAHDLWCKVIDAKPLVFGWGRWRHALRVAEMGVLSAATGREIHPAATGALSLVGTP
jgi:hypothetical protein